LTVVVSQENSTRVFLLSHLYILDHLVSTLYTLLFALVWWLYIPHDGRRVSNSPAQAAMVALAKARGDIALSELEMDDEDRAEVASVLWGQERAFAVGVLVVCWFLKVRLVFLDTVEWGRQARARSALRLISASTCSSPRSLRRPQIYFSLILYSFASHLRQNSYRALPLSTTPASSGAAISQPVYSSVPSRTPSRAGTSSARKEEEEGEEIFDWDREGGGKEGKVEH
jgi:hypothetical protein